MLSKIRYWIIEFLAGDDTIILNAYFISPCHFDFDFDSGPWKGIIRKNAFKVGRGEKLTISGTHTYREEYEKSAGA